MSEQHSSKQLIAPNRRRKAARWRHAMTNPAALAMEQRRFRGIASSLWLRNSHRPGASFNISPHCCGPLQTLFCDTVRAFSRARYSRPSDLWKLLRPGGEFHQRNTDDLTLYGGSWPDTGGLNPASKPHALSWRLLWACCTMHPLPSWLCAILASGIAVIAIENTDIATHMLRSKVLSAAICHTYRRSFGK